MLRLRPMLPMQVSLLLLQHSSVLVNHPALQPLQPPNQLLLLPEPSPVSILLGPPAQLLRLPHPNPSSTLPGPPSHAHPLCVGGRPASFEDSVMECEWPNQTKLHVYETADCTRSFDQALLTETQCEESDVFRGYSKFSLPLVNPGAAGEGTCVLVHPRLQGSVSLWKLQPEAQAVWVRVRASGIGLGRDVFVACVYIPPAGSAQLLSHSLSEHMSGLKAAVTSPRPMVMSFLAVISMPWLGEWIMCWCLIDSFWRAQAFPVKGAAPTPL